MNSYWLVFCVFVIGFGWGAVAVLVLFWAKAKTMLDFCTRILKLQKDILEDNDNVQKKMFEYANLVKKGFDISCQRTDKVVEGLNKLIDAVREDDEDETD